MTKKYYDLDPKQLGIPAIVIYHGNHIDGGSYEEALHNGLSDIEATASAWDMDYETAQKAKYVISTYNGKVIDIYYNSGIRFSNRIRAKYGRNKNAERIIFKLMDTCSENFKKEYVGKIIKKSNGAPWVTSWK